jgi:hypothetical protein
VYTGEMFFGARSVFGERRQLYETGDGRIPVDKPPLNVVLHDQLSDNVEKSALSRIPEE